MVNGQQNYPYPITEFDGRLCLRATHKIATNWTRQFVNWPNSLILLWTNEWFFQHTQLKMASVRTYSIIFLFLTYWIRHSKNHRFGWNACEKMFKMAVRAWLKAERTAGWPDANVRNADRFCGFLLENWMGKAVRGTRNVWNVRSWWRLVTIIFLFTQILEHIWTYLLQIFI